MEDFQMNMLKNGDIVEGEVITVTPTYAYLNVNYMMDALLELKNFSYDNTDNLTKVLKVGDKLTVAVVRLGEEALVVSRTVIERQERLNALIAQAEAKEVVTVTFGEQSPGGLVGRYHGVRVFMPKSQTDTHRVEDFSTYMNTPIEARIVEFDGKRNQLIVSHRQVKEEARVKAIEAALSTISVDDEVTAKVVTVQDNGAVLELNGMEVWLPGREVSHHRSHTPFDVLKVGQEVAVKVISINPERQNVVVSKKALEKTPWALAVEKFKTGNIVEGKVLDIIAVGAIVELIPGVSGLVHISEVSYDKHKKVEDVLKVGQVIKVKIIGMDEAKHRVSLSVKQLEASPWDAVVKSYRSGDKISGIVKKVTDKVAFVEVAPFVEAVLPVGEATIARVASMRDVVTEGQTVDAQIIDLQPRKERMEISILALEAAAEREAFQSYQDSVKNTADEEIESAFSGKFDALK